MENDREVFKIDFFICGFVGKRDKNGLPDKLLVCPVEGADWSVVYEKTGKTFGTGY